MPEIEHWLHYRCVDVSTVKELVKPVKFPAKRRLPNCISSGGRSKRAPLVKADQVILAAEGDSLVFLTLHVDSLAHLDLVREVFGKALVPSGKYFIFAGNVDIAKKYQLDLDGVTFYVLPLDEATVYNEILDLLYIEKGDLKKLSNEGKIDAIVAAAGNSRGGFPVTPYAQALAEMGPIKVADNRPV